MKRFFAKNRKTPPIGSEIHRVRYEAREVGSKFIWDRKVKIMRDVRVRDEGKVIPVSDYEPQTKTVTQSMTGREIEISGVCPKLISGRNVAVLWQSGLIESVPWADCYREIPKRKGTSK